MVEPPTRMVLRMRQAPVTAGAWRLDQPIGRFAGDETSWSARLGPDEWLLAGNDPAIQAALSGHLVDVSHRQVQLAVAGPDAAATLNAGCPLDLDEAAFPPGAAT